MRVPILIDVFGNDPKSVSVYNEAVMGIVLKAENTKRYRAWVEVPADIGIDGDAVAGELEEVKG